MRKTLRERRYYNASVGRVGVRVFFRPTPFFDILSLHECTITFLRKKKKTEKKAKKKEWRGKKKENGGGKKTERKTERRRAQGCRCTPSTFAA